MIGYIIGSFSYFFMSVFFPVMHKIALGDPEVMLIERNEITNIFKIRSMFFKIKLLDHAIDPMF